MFCDSREVGQVGDALALSHQMGPPLPPIYGSTTTAFQMFSVGAFQAPAFQSSWLLFRDAWVTFIGGVVAFAGLKTSSFFVARIKI